MAPQSGSSSQGGHTGRGRYRSIPPDKAMTLASAMSCFNGPKPFTAVTDYFVTELDRHGNIGSRAYTVVISNHRPSEMDQKRINEYVSSARPGSELGLLRSQSNLMIDYQRARSVAENDVGTYWGRVTPHDMLTVIRQERKRDWDNLRAEEQLRQSQHAARVGIGATAATLDGPVVFPNSDLGSMKVEFCGKTPCSFVQPSILFFIDSTGKIICPSSLSHHTNFMDNAARTMVNTLVPRLNVKHDPEVRNLKALEMTDDLINSHNALRRPGQRFWTRVDHSRFHELLNSHICDARLYGGIGGVNVSVDNTDGRFSNGGAHLTQSWCSPSQPGVPS
jgi:hypothetical protein